MAHIYNNRSEIEEVELESNKQSITVYYLEVEQAKTMSGIHQSKYCVWHSTKRQSMRMSIKN